MDWEKIITSIFVVLIIGLAVLLVFFVLPAQLREHRECVEKGGLPVRGVNGIACAAPR